jgi:hypothetical protein
MPRPKCHISNIPDMKIQKITNVIKVAKKVIKLKNIFIKKLPLEKPDIGLRKTCVKYATAKHHRA